MTTINNSFTDIPPSFIYKWQEIANLLAVIIKIPSALIMKTENEFMEVFISSVSENNPYHVGNKEHWHGLYCETVIQSQKELLIPNATIDKNWDKNPDIKIGMIAYLGFPINFPDNQPFGTLCVLDNKENHFLSEHEQLIKHFKNVIELDLALLQSIDLKTNDFDKNIIDQLLNKNKELLIAKEKAEEHEEKLNDNNSALNLAMQVAKMAWWKMDIASGNVIFEKRKAEMLEYSSDKFKHYKDFTDLIHPEDYDNAMNAMRNHFNGKYDKYEVEYRIKTKSGEYVWFYDIGCIGKRDSNGTPINITGIVVNITERKQAEQALKESEEKYRLLAENLTDVIWVLNLTQNKYSYISPSVFQLTGFPVDEAMKQSIEESLAPASTEHIRQRLPAAVKSFLENPNQKKHHYNEIQQICKDGKYIWVETIIQPQFAKNGDIEVLGVSRNIEKRKALEAEIQKQIVQLGELNATKDKFFGIIAHDLKNPFNSILGFSELLLKNIDKYDIEKITKFVGTINSSSKNAYKLLENLLEWSRAQTGKIDFKPENLIIENLIIDVIALFSNSAKAKDIFINYIIPDSLVVFADRNMLNTILRNLITNAIKFTKKNGQITITAVQKNNEVEVNVSDTGIGMDKNTKNKLFKISEKITTLGTGKEEGTGLGLLLCKEFVEKQGGKIWVDSELGKGSIFKFTLPK